MSLHMPRFFPVGDGRESRLPRRATAVLAALPAALLLATSGALLAPGSAAAAPGDDITDQCLEMSQNGGPWVKPAAFDPSGTDYIPIPGDEGTQLAFNVRNVCDLPATLTLFSESWSVSGGGTATVRGKIDGQVGQQFVIGPNANSSTRIELVKTPLAQNANVMAGFMIGIPASEVLQGYEINPGWGLVLVEGEPARGRPQCSDRLVSGRRRGRGGYTRQGLRQGRAEQHRHCHRRGCHLHRHRGYEWGLQLQPDYHHTRQSSDHRHCDKCGWDQPRLRGSHGQGHGENHRSGRQQQRFARQ